MGILTHSFGLKSEVLFPPVSLLSLQHLAVLAFAEAEVPLSAYLEPKWCLVKFKQAPVGCLKSNLRFFWIRRRKKEKRSLPFPSTFSLGFLRTLVVPGCSNWIRAHTGLCSSIEC